MQSTVSLDVPDYQDMSLLPRPLLKWWGGGLLSCLPLVEIVLVIAMAGFVLLSLG
ncbi:MAG: hypothetical protein AAFN76_13820 [Pseudomonadota bacterium]